MLHWSQVRAWANRDDGRWHRGGNHSLRWYQAIGCVMFLGALLWWNLAAKSQVASGGRLPWVVFGIGVFLFTAPWRPETWQEPPN